MYKRQANDLEELNHVLRDQMEQLQKKAAHYDEIVKISAAIKSENEQLSRQQEELSRQLANETAAKKAVSKQKLPDLRYTASCWNVYKMVKTQSYPIV